MKRIFIILLFLIIAFIAGIFFQRLWLTSTDNSSTPSTATKQKEILYWVAPMDPNYRRDKPGKSPMGMDLVPVYADSQSSDEGQVKISPVVENNLGVKTELVKSMDLNRIINTIGYVTVDENNIDNIHTYTDGWVRVLNVKASGDEVEKGELLLKLYSPTLINSQQEYLLALRENNQGLIDASINKMKTLGIPQSLIKKIIKTRKADELVSIFATRSGIISTLNVREGAYVKPDTDIMSIEDLSQIWLIADVFESQSEWVKVGQAAIASLPYLPGKAWQGKVDYIYPQLDPNTHSLRVRMTFPNPDLSFKPNMFAEIKIFANPDKNALVIPLSALIQTGEGARVVVALGNGQFNVQPVVIGIESDDLVSIRSGLKEGDRIVTSAQFLIDSESNLSQSLSRMTDPNQQQEEAPIPQELISMGEVKVINREQSTMSIYHQPIAALNMPAMVMEIPVSKQVPLNEVKVGDSISFVIIKQSDDKYLITKIDVLEKN